jgi:hypothetical protein
MQATNQQTKNETSTAQQVAELCGNKECRIFRVVRLLAGYWEKESWFIASQKIADEVNGGRTRLEPFSFTSKRTASKPLGREVTNRSAL